MKLSKLFNEPVKMNRTHVATYARRALEMEKGEQGPLASRNCVAVGSHVRPRRVGFGGQNGEGEPAYYYMAKPGVAVVPMYGAIYHGIEPWMEDWCGLVNPARVDKGLRDASLDPTVTSIVLDIDSPGGTIMGTSEVSETLALVKQSKPVYAITEGLMCSAAYEIACGATEVFASSGAFVGSIGVYMAWLDSTGFWEKMGFAFEVFKAGEHKAIGVPGRELTESDRNMLQGQIDGLYAAFKNTVCAARAHVPDSAMQGQDFVAIEALMNKLIDGVAKFDEIIAVI